MLIATLLTGCKSSDYDTAISALNNSCYEEAIELFVSLGTYKDSAEQLISAINEYANALLEKDKYDNAISLYEQYSDHGDFESRIAELNTEKEQYEIYCSAMELLKDESIDEGFELLSVLPSEYRNVEEIYQTYDDLKDVPFTGTHTNKQGKQSQQIKFSLIFSIDKERFYLHAYKAVYYSDGSIYKNYDFNLDIDDIDGDTIKVGKFTWRLNENGKIIETEKGTTAIYS